MTEETPEVEVTEADVTEADVTHFAEDENPLDHIGEPVEYELPAVEVSAAETEEGAA